MSVINSKFNILQQFIIKLCFVFTKERFFRQLSMLLEVGIPLHEALQSMREAALIHQGIFKEHFAMIGVIDDGIYRLNIGYSNLADLLSGYLSERERLMLAQSKSHIGKAIESILFLTKRLSDLKKDIIKFSLAPLGALIIVIGMIYGCSYYLFPKLLASFKLSELPRNTQALYYFTQGFVDHVMLIGFGTMISVLAICLSFKHLSGRSRHILDYFIPWCIYKRMVGISFLLTLSQLIADKTPFDQVIDALSQGASCYLNTFLQRARVLRAQGANVGQALSQMGLIPRQMGADIGIFTKALKFEQGLSYLAQKGLDQELFKLKSLFVLIAMIGILLSIGFGIWAFFAIGSIANALQSPIPH